MSRNQTGQFICHLWCMLTIPLLMHQLAFNHTSSCLGARHQCPVTIGLGLTIINQSFKSKTIWLNQQLNAMLHVNKQALKLIKNPLSAIKTAPVARIFTCVLLHDHLEGHNKIQDWYKSDVYIVIGLIWSPMFIIFNY